MNRIPRATVQPERPGLLSKACPNLPLISGLDDVQGLLALADWAAEDDKAIVDQPIHEGGVLIPGVLNPDLTRGVPARAVGQPHREIGHGQRVLTATDTRGTAAWLSASKLTARYAA